MSAVVFEFSEKGAAAVLKALKEAGVEAERSSKKIEAARAREIKAATNAAAKIIKENKKALDQQEKDHKKFLKNQEALVKKDTNFRIKEAQKAAKAREKSFAFSLGSSVSGIDGKELGGKIGASIGSAIKYGIVGAIGAATALAVAAVRSNLKLAELANRVSVTARKPGQEFANQKEIINQVRGSAISNPGVESQGLMGGLQKFVEGSGGNIGMGKNLLPTMATTMSATGLGGEETGSLFAQLGKEFHLESVKEYQDAIAQINIAAKESSMSFADMAQNVINSGQDADRFGLKLKEITALTAIAGKGGGNIKTVEKVWAKLESGKLGVHTRDVQGNVRSARDVMFDLISKTGGTSPIVGKERALEKGIGAKAMSAIAQPFGAYKKAYEEAGGDKNAVEARKAGEIALSQALDQAFNSTSSYSEMQKDAAESQNTASAQLQAAYEKLQQSVGDGLTGPLTKLATAAGDAVPALAGLTTAVASVIEALAAMLPGGESPANKAKSKLREFDEKHKDDLWESNDERAKLVGEVEKANKEENATYSEADYATEFANKGGATPGSKEWQDAYAHGVEDYQISKKEATTNGGKISTTDKMINMLDAASAGYTPEQLSYAKLMQENMGKASPEGVVDKSGNGVAKANKWDPSLEPGGNLGNQIYNQQNPNAPTVENLNAKAFEGDVKKASSSFHKSVVAAGTALAAIIKDSANRVKPKD